MREDESLEDICFGAILKSPFQEQNVSEVSDKETKMWEELSESAYNSENEALWRQIDDANSDEMFTVISQSSAAVLEPQQR